MSTKRSDALKKLLVGSIQSASETPAELTVFGSGKAPEPESGVGSLESSKEEDPKPESSTAPSAPVSTLTSYAPTPARAELVSEKALSPAPLAPAPMAASFLTRVPAAKPPSWAKLSITLETGDLEILDRFHASARDAGVKMRRGGNPSLFIRAALRAFEELSESSPEAWAERLASVITRDGT